MYMNEARSLTPGSVAGAVGCPPSCSFSFFFVSKIIVRADMAFKPAFPFPSSFLGIRIAMMFTPVECKDDLGHTRECLHPTHFLQALALGWNEKYQRCL